MSGASKKPIDTQELRALLALASRGDVWLLKDRFYIGAAPRRLTVRP